MVCISSIDIFIKNYEDVLRRDESFNDLKQYLEQNEEQVNGFFDASLVQIQDSGDRVVLMVLQRAIDALLNQEHLRTYFNALEDSYQFECWFVQINTDIDKFNHRWNDTC